MIGAILGDIVGSPYEFDRGKKVKDFGPWWRLQYAHLYCCRDRGGLRNELLINRITMSYFA